MALDLYLRADDREAMRSALVSAGLTDAEGAPLAGVTLDEVGRIVRFRGDLAEELPGWHANVRVFGLTEAQLEALGPLVLPPPSRPFRVFA